MLSFNAALVNISIQSSLMISMLLRNIIFAQMLSPNEFGIAMTFGVVLSLFEYISNFGHENLMQRASFGDRRKFQATVHASLIFRGIAVAVFIYSLSHLISEFLKIPKSTFNYAILAIVPLINAFMHTDHQRFHREHNYIATAKISITADILSVVVAFTLANIWDSYWAFYISFVFRHSIGTIFSHVWAKRPYLLSVNLKYMNELVKFGLPLLFVGLLKYLGGESDKALVTRYIGLEEFTSYFLALMLVIGTTNFISVGFAKIFIRRISIHKTKGKQLKAANENVQVLLLVILPLVFTLGVFGEEVTLLIFGQTYQKQLFLQPIICILISFRITNSWLYQITIASDNTNKLLISDICKLSGLLLAFFVASLSNILILCSAFIVGEIVYFIVLSYQLAKTRPLLWKMITNVLCVVVINSFIIYQSYNVSMNWHVLDKLILVILYMILVTGAFYIFSGYCRKQFKYWRIHLLKVFFCK